MEWCWLVSVILVTIISSVIGQFEDEEEQYRGQLIGSLSSYHHQVRYRFNIQIGNIV